MREPIENWIVCISGYLQGQGNAEQGIPALAHGLQIQHGSHARVEFHTWNSDWSGIAEWIFRTSQNGKPPTIMLVAYSWGVGFGATRFIRELRHRKLRVNCAVFADGVYHFGGPLFHKCGVSQLAAYTTRLGNRKTVKLEDNIDEVHWFRQDDMSILQPKTWLRGHQLVYRKTGVPLPNEVLLSDVTHSYIDEAPEFKRKVMECANKLFNSPTVEERQAYVAAITTSQVKPPETPK